MSDIQLRRLRPGGKIGDELTVIAKLSKGNRDPIYLVWHSGTSCPVVCKMFRSPRRANREAAAARLFAHPNIVRFLGAEAPAYVLMEYLDGPRLDTFVERRPRGRLNVSDALRFGIHLAAALNHLHDKGYVHMDVKPSNIAVVNGRPVLFDFGSMRDARDPRPGHIVGTDPYIAPEEIRLEQTSYSADVFSFGVTLFEALTGKLPFPEARRGRPYPQLTERPASLRATRRGISKALDDLLLACLAQNPADRPSMRELIPRLNALIERGPKMWPDSFRPFADRPTDSIRKAA